MSNPRHGDTIPPSHTERWCEIHQENHPAHMVCHFYEDPIIVDLFEQCAGQFDDAQARKKLKIPDLEIVMIKAREHEMLAEWFQKEWPEAMVEGSTVDNAIRIMTEFKMMKQIAKSFGKVIEDPTTPDHIRPDIRKALDAYAKNRQPTGKFLRLVLCNDLVGAMGKADHHNLQTMPAIVSYVYNHVPSNAWGNADKVTQWLDSRCVKCGGDGLDKGSACPDCKGMGHK